MTEIDSGGWGHEPEPGRLQTELVPVNADLGWCEEFTERYGGKKRAKIKVENCLVEEEHPHQSFGPRKFRGEFFGEIVDGRIIRVLLIPMFEENDEDDEGDDEDAQDEPRRVDVPHLLLDQVITSVEPLTHRKNSQVMVELAGLQEIELVDQYDFLQ